jgi:fucose permease
MLAQFMYVGAQVGTWSYLIQYVQDSTHLPEKPAANYLIASLVAFGVGRFVSTALMRVVRPNRLMGAYAVINVMLVTVGVLHPGWIGVWAMVLTSFFMSLMFPTIFALGLKGLGPNTKIGGSLIVMAIVGGAALTPLMGLINDRTHSIALAYLVPLVGYVCVAAYAFLGATRGLAADAAPSEAQASALIAGQGNQPRTAEFVEPDKCAIAVSCLQEKAAMSTEPEAPTAAEVSAEETKESSTLKVIGWLSVGLAVATVGFFVGRELLSRYKFNHRDPIRLLRSCR